MWYRFNPPEQSHQLLSIHLSHTQKSRLNSWIWTPIWNEPPPLATVATWKIPNETWSESIWPSFLTLCSPAGWLLGDPMKWSILFQYAQSSGCHGNAHCLQFVFPQCIRQKNWLSRQGRLLNTALIPSSSSGNRSFSSFTVCLSSYSPQHVLLWTPSAPTQSLVQPPDPIKLGVWVAFQHVKWDV